MGGLNSCFLYMGTSNSAWLAGLLGSFYNCLIAIFYVHSFVSFWFDKSRFVCGGEGVLGGKHAICDAVSDAC